jgi:hypothetical protein
MFAANPVPVKTAADAVFAFPLFAFPLDSSGLRTLYLGKYNA